METICMKHQILFSWENKKNIDLSSAELAKKVVKVNVGCEMHCIGVTEDVPLYGPRQAKMCFRACANCAAIHHPAHAQSVIRTFALHWNILAVCGQWRSWSDCAFRTAKALIKLYECTVWSGPSLSAHARRQVFAWRDPVVICNKWEKKMLI